MSGDGTIDPKFIEIAGAKAAEGTYLTFSPDAKKIPTAKVFIDAYEKIRRDRALFNICIRCGKCNAYCDKKATTKDSKAIIEKLHSMEFNGAVGKIKFDEKGDVAVAPYVVWITKNGKFEEYWKP